MYTPNVSRINRVDNQRGLIFQTIEDLHRAVLVYGNLDSPTFESDLQQIKDTIGDTRILAPLVNRDSVAFAQNVVAEIGQLDSGSRFRQHWEYEGPGPFRKCTIGASRNQDNTFALSIWVAGIDHEPEARLAKLLDAQIGYEDCLVERTYAVNGNRFAIPLKDIEAVYTAFGQPFNRDNFLQAVLPAEPYTNYFDQKADYKTSPVLLIADEDLRVKFGFTPWRAFEHRHDQPPRPVWPETRWDLPSVRRDYGYRVEGEALTGPAIVEKGNPQPIGLEVAITPKIVPTYDKALAQRIRDMGDAIEHVWKVPTIPLNALSGKAPQQNPEAPGFK
jgi:hypothetical protein